MEYEGYTPMSNSKLTEISGVEVSYNDLMNQLSKLPGMYINQGNDYLTPTNSIHLESLPANSVSSSLLQGDQAVTEPSSDHVDSGNI